MEPFLALVLVVVDQSQTDGGDPPIGHDLADRGRPPCAANLLLLAEERLL
jgi:hypothetical protein